MKNRLLSHLALLALTYAISMSACISPDDREVVMAGDPDASFIVPSLGGAATEAGPGNTRSGNMCPSSECPAPLLTCSTSKFLCDIDPLTDNQNCGACGNVCGGEYVSLLGGTFQCVDGACKFTCTYPYADCD